MVAVIETSLFYCPGFSFCVSDLPSMTPTDKRKERDDVEHSPSIFHKRLKAAESGDHDNISHSIGAQELVSAFALATLATMCPTKQMMSETVYESRDADQGEDAAPITPDIRSPAYSGSKRVTFSNDTKETSRKTSRKMSLPPRLLQRGSRLPPGFARNPHTARHYRHQSSHWVRQHTLTQQRSVTGIVLPPPPPPPPSHTPATQANDKWICDFCNIAAFDTYQEACHHEESCRIRCSNMHRQVSEWPYFGGQRQIYTHSHPFMHPSETTQANSMYPESLVVYDGIASLAVPDTDGEWLSALTCFVREKCVEAFSATSEDIGQGQSTFHTALKQVGIRCRFCCHLSKANVQPGAVFFPASISSIFDAVYCWHTTHAKVCEFIPPEVSSKLQGLDSPDAWMPATRPYWTESARSLGMIDTRNGIRFTMKPKPSLEELVTGRTCSEAANRDRSDTASRREGLNQPNHDEPALRGGESIVFTRDIALVPPYVYFLMRQVESTHFTEADRFVARSKGPVGYAGFQCRHCQGHAGLGKYFPVSAKSLSTNSTSQNIHSHLLKCRKVTPFVKEQLIVLKDEKGKAPRLEPGWRRIFFEKIWERLHG